MWSWGVLETGASGTWVIPSVAGTVEDVVNDLKGGGRVLLVDGVRCATLLCAEGTRIRGYWLTLTRSPQEPHLLLVYLFAFVISYLSAVPPLHAHSTSD